MMGGEIGLNPPPIRPLARDWAGRYPSQWRANPEDCWPVLMSKPYITWPQIAMMRGFMAPSPGPIRPARAGRCGADLTGGLARHTSLPVSGSSAMMSPTGFRKYKEAVIKWRVISQERPNLPLSQTQAGFSWRHWCGDLLSGE
jgi:hypothetical protein